MLKILDSVSILVLAILHRKPRPRAPITLIVHTQKCNSGGWFFTCVKYTYNIYDNKLQEVQRGKLCITKYLMKWLYYRVSQKKCPTFKKLYCLKYEYLIMGFIMICLDWVILPEHLGNIFIWISACMPKHQTIFTIFILQTIQLLKNGTFFLTHSVYLTNHSTLDEQYHPTCASLGFFSELIREVLQMYSLA